MNLSIPFAAQQLKSNEVFCPFYFCAILQVDVSAISECRGSAAALLHACFETYADRPCIGWRQDDTFVFLSSVADKQKQKKTKQKVKKKNKKK